jgi:hypothetical protein
MDASIAALESLFQKSAVAVVALPVRDAIGRANSRFYSETDANLAFS